MAKFEIESRYSSEVLYTLEGDTLKDAVAKAIANRQPLRGADLSDADLSDADLSDADLSDADLRGAVLRGADLSWQSHDLLAEVLRREAGEDVEKRMIAGLILVSRDWCWLKFLSLQVPQREWALSVLARYAANDENAPEALRTLAGKSA